MTVVAVICAVLLSVAAALTTFRAMRGPGTLDRLVAVDTLIAVAMCALAVWAAWHLETSAVPAIVALSLVGFLGSVSVARFRVRDK